MIPKVIHYCWFGRGEMPALAKKCIASWKKNCPDYELRLWNEDSFDVNSHPFVKEAYEARKFAFVTDYIRLWALVHEGGIYMDTDVEVLRPLDEFLCHKAFSGYETKSVVPTGIMGSEKGGAWATKQLAYYADKHFLKADGKPDMTPNTKIITDRMVAEGFVPNNRKQDFKGEIVIYPSDWFCPKNPGSGRIEVSENTRTIHYYAGSWGTPWMKYKGKILRSIRRYFPNAFARAREIYHRFRKP